MALNTLNTDAISFKKLNGKAHTQQSFAVTEEGITTNVQSSYSTVFSNSIEPLPVTNSGLTALYSTNGIVERVKFQVDIIPDTQIAVGRSQGYRLKLPADYNASGELFPQFSAGTYLHNALGKLQIVPSLYGQLKIDGTTEYDPILYQTNGSTVIAKFDPINWILDPYNGILFVQDPPVGYDVSASRPGFVEAFLYVGDYLDDVIFSISSGATGTTGQNVGGAEGIFKDTIADTGGTTVLRFKTLFGTNGITVTGDSDNVFITFSGTSIVLTGGTNGLSKIGSNVVLGGTLTGNTSILGSGKNLTLGTNPSKLNSFEVTTSGGTFLTYDDSVDQAYLSMTNSAVGFTSNFGGNLYNLKIDSTSNGLVLSAAGNQLIVGNNGNGLSVTLNGTDQFNYDNDYSVNFGPRSLVDKGFVTGLTSTSGVQTANNGLTKTGTNVRLGGVLTGDTVIDANGNHALTITGYDGGLYFNDTSGGGTFFNDTGAGGIYLESAGGGISIIDTGGGGVSIVDQNLGGLSIQSNGGGVFIEDSEVSGNIELDSRSISLISRSTAGPQMRLNMNQSGSIFIDNRTGTTAVGIQYNVDYSPNFIPRSLVDKGYVDNAVLLGSAPNIQVVSINTTVTGDTIFVVTSGSSITVTLPASPSNGDKILVKDSTGNALINNIIINGNGNNIDGSATVTINTDRGSISIIFSTHFNEWQIVGFVN